MSISPKKEECWWAWQSYVHWVFMRCKVRGNKHYALWWNVREHVCIFILQYWCLKVLFQVQMSASSTLYTSGVLVLPLEGLCPIGKRISTCIMTLISLNRFGWCIWGRSHHHISNFEILSGHTGCDDVFVKQVQNFTFQKQFSFMSLIQFSVFNSPQIVPVTVSKNI